MKTENRPLKAKYQKPAVCSKKVEFMTNTFATPVIEISEVYGPYRRPPRRS